MSRVKWKGPFLANFFFKKKIKNYKKIWSRTSMIPSFLIGQTVLVYSGQKFRKVYISREKVGFKFGEFCFTRVMKKKIHNKKIKKK